MTLAFDFPTKFVPLLISIWDGNPDNLKDQPLLVWAEQGFGDNIQFVRYVQILIELASMSLVHP